MKRRKKKSKIQTFFQLLLIVFAASLFFTPENSDKMFLSLIIIFMIIGLLLILLSKCQFSKHAMPIGLPDFHRKKSCSQALDTETLLWRQISYQITDKLRGSFPEAKWEFVKQPEINQLLNCQVIRIRTYNTDNYNFAEFCIDPYGHLNLELLTISSLKRKCEKEAPLEPPQIDPESWYSLVGKQVLMEIIGDLQARGHQQLFISETGEIFVLNGDSQEYKGKLEHFPPKSHWDVLCDILIQDELNAEEIEDKLELSWS